MSGQEGGYVAGGRHSEKERTHEKRRENRPFSVRTTTQLVRRGGVFGDARTWVFRPSPSGGTRGPRRHCHDKGLRVPPGSGRGGCGRSRGDKNGCVNLHPRDVESVPGTGDGGVQDMVNDYPSSTGEDEVADSGSQGSAGGTCEGCGEQRKIDADRKRSLVHDTRGCRVGTGTPESLDLPGVCRSGPGRLGVRWVKRSVSVDSGVLRRYLSW